MQTLRKQAAKFGSCIRSQGNQRPKRKQKASGELGVQIQNSGRATCPGIPIALCVAVCEREANLNTNPESAARAEQQAWSTTVAQVSRRELCQNIFQIKSKQQFHTASLLIWYHSKRLSLAVPVITFPISVHIYYG